MGLLGGLFGVRTFKLAFFASLILGFSGNALAEQPEPVSPSKVIEILQYSWSVRGERVVTSSEIYLMIYDSPLSKVLKAIIDKDLSAQVLPQTSSDWQSFRNAVVDARLNTNQLLQAIIGAQKTGMPLPEAIKKVATPTQVTRTRPLPPVTRKAPPRVVEVEVEERPVKRKIVRQTVEEVVEEEAPRKMTPEQAFYQEFQDVQEGQNFLDDVVKAAAAQRELVPTKASLRKFLGNLFIIARTQTPKRCSQDAKIELVIEHAIMATKKWALRTGATEVTPGMTANILLGRTMSSVGAPAQSYAEDTVETFYQTWVLGVESSSTSSR